MRAQSSRRSELSSEELGSDFGSDSGSALGFDLLLFPGSDLDADFGPDLGSDRARDRPPSGLLLPAHFGPLGIAPVSISVPPLSKNVKGNDPQIQKSEKESLWEGADSASKGPPSGLRFGVRLGVHFGSLIALYLETFGGPFRRSKIGFCSEPGKLHK